MPQWKQNSRRSLEQKSCFVLGAACGGEGGPRLPIPFSCRQRGFILVVLLHVLALGTGPLQAETFTWTGGSIFGNNWSDGGFTRTSFGITDIVVNKSGAGELRLRNDSRGMDQLNITGTGQVLLSSKTATMTITASQSYTGTTSITSGTLQLSNSGRLSNATDVSIASGATFDLNGVSDTVDQSVTVHRARVE